MPTEDLIYFDLDNGSVTAACVSPTSQRPREAQLADTTHVKLPEPHATELRRALESIEKTAVQVDSQGVMLAFFQFFVAIFGGYRRHLRDEGTHDAFDNDEFRRSHPSKTREFLEG